MQKRSLTVLAIDDDPDDVDTLRRCLEALRDVSCELRSCGSLHEGLAYMGRGRVDVVLVDYPLGTGDDMAALRALTNGDEQLCSAVIMITDQGDEEVAAEAIKAGALDYISKARLSPEVLYYSIRSALEKAELRRQIDIQRTELLKLSRCDDLTGLLNRRALLACLDREFERSKRYGSPLHVMLIDIDHFKSVNDRYGHLPGDDVLRAIGAALRSRVRSTDAAGRIGGDEFCLVIVEVGTDGVRIFANRLQDAFRKLEIPTIREEISPTTCSIGIAAFSPGMASPRQLLERADRALYDAKMQGRDRISVL